MNNWTRLLFGATALTTTLAAAPAFAAGLDEQVTFNIAPGSLDEALIAYSQQADLQVISASTAVRGKQTQGVEGAATPREALAMLLKDSGLSFVATSPSTVTVTGEQGASGSTGAGATVEALIVTAQKREEDIQDVPIAISAFSQEDLTRSQIAGGPDLITQVPNFTFTKTNFSSYSIQIRGIGTQAISATTDPAVAVAFNNTPFIRNRFFEQEFYDLQRVEVLRGPQGTLYGRNATAGVVNIISAKPKFYPEAKLSGDIGNYSSSRIEGMVNIPLVEDTVALRLAGAWTKRDGYAFNAIKGKPIDGRDLWSTRLSLRFTPSDRLEANLIWEHFEEDDDRLRSGKQLCNKDVVEHVGPIPTPNYYNLSPSGNLFSGIQASFSQGCERDSLYSRLSLQRPNGVMLPYYVPLGAIGLPIALKEPYVSVVNTFDAAVINATNDQPLDWRVIESALDPRYRAKTDIAEFQLHFDLTDELSLDSETAYAVDFVHSFQDFNRFNSAAGAWSTTGGTAQAQIARGVLGEDGVFCDPQLGCSDRLVAADVSTANSWQFSQELRLASDFDGPFNFSLGANYLRSDSEDKYYVFINSLSLIAAHGLFANYTYDYVGGETDNIGCLPNGPVQGNPNAVYSAVHCIYIDPNPINSLNDEGHNYFLSRNPYSLVSYAVFGEAYYNFTDDLKVTAGLRWTVDSKTAPLIPTWLLASKTVGLPVAETIHQEWREPTGRLAIDWKPDLSFTDETLLYASYAHGYKAGGANPPGFVRVYYSNSTVATQQAGESATRPKTFDAEFVDAFEIGTKNTLLDGKVTLNANAFYYDYTGYQISEIVDRSAFNRNFDAEVWGAEIEADWRPLENLRLSLKGGYEKTRIADGEEAIDLMDRTAGDPDWLLVRPFPTFASSCIVPTYVFVNPPDTDPSLQISPAGNVGGGGPGPCELAYSYGVDPVYGVPGVTSNYSYGHPGYPGFDPSTAPNGGEGIAKPLGGNELPNAPNWTATLSGDYTLPLTGDWLVDLHTDIHWQSDSYWRVFNDHEYNKLDEYFTMNLAAIITNEPAGWTVMAYIKNVTNETAITGAFLNSDDTGLTTNIFLTEPRLYGLRVTKAWSDAPWLGGLSERHDGPYPLTIAIGGQVQRWDAPNEAVLPTFTDAFTAPFDILNAPQNKDLDWGDGRDVKVTWRPDGGRWTVAAAYRSGETNGSAKTEVQQPTDPVCGFTSPAICAQFAGTVPLAVAISRPDFVNPRAREREEFEIADISAGMDMSLAPLNRSTVSAGLRWARLESWTNATVAGVPDWNIQAGLLQTRVPATHTLYQSSLGADRSFEGVGPIVAWDAAYSLVEFDNGGHFDLDWTVSGGVLFGDRETTLTGDETVTSYSLVMSVLALDTGNPGTSTPVPTDPVNLQRSDNVTVPVLGGSLGLSYEIDRFSIGAGYRWERYFDALDVGYSEAKDGDRTIDGPYFKLSVGFGG